MSEVANNEQHENTVELAAAPAAAPATVAAVDEVAVDAAAAGDAANALFASKPTEIASSPKVDNKKTPAKRTPSKRMSFIERAQKESEELVKNMGGSLELEGGRRTRSSMRGTPTHVVVASTPPPTKKARTSPANATNTTPSRARGRGRKIDTSVEPAEEEAKKQEAEIADEQESADENKDEKMGAEKANSKEKQVKDVTKELETDRAVKPKEVGSGSVEESTGNVADAPLETVPEEKQNNVDHAVEAEEKPKESTRTDSPMDTAEPIETGVKIVSEPAATKTTVEQSETKAAVKESAELAATIATEAKASAAVPLPVPTPVAQKEPTPEPMDVDSCSKSNAIVDETLPAAAAPKPAPLAVEEAVENSNKKAVSEIVEVSDSAPQEESTAAEETAVNLNSNEVNAVKNDSKSTPTEILKSVDTKADVEPVDPEPEATTGASNNATPACENKPDNDFCEPKIKIASPPMNVASDGAATTPQYCN